MFTHATRREMLPGDEELFGLCDTTTNRPAASSTAAVCRSLPHVEAPNTLEITVNNELFEHQRVGVKWLYERHCKGSGALLADEMGLGKTAQVSTFIGEMQKKGSITSCVLVCPPTLVTVWTEGLQRWGKIPPNRIRDALGTKKQREGVWSLLSHRTPVVILSTYGVMKNDKDLIQRYSMDYLVFDEAHCIRDPSTEVFKAAVLLQPRAIHRIAITGTPLMNNFEDMWALFAFIDPGALGSTRKEFQATSSAIHRGNEKDSSRSEKEQAAQRLAALREAIRPLTLRREKRDVYETMNISKLDLVVWCHMTDVQTHQYYEFINSDVVRLALREIHTKQPLVLLTALRMMCNHPWLNFNEENFARAMITPACPPSEFPDFGDIFGGVKVNVAVSLIRHFTADRLKTLVFSRSKRLLDILGSLLAAKAIAFVRIDGDVAVDRRGKLVAAFNNSPDVSVCLITAQVGGVGLTFQSASRVILLDPSWNPAVDAQAVDRVHRIGQTQDVVVCRLIACGTVDEMIYRNQVFKTMAAKQVGTDSAVPPELRRYFSHTELRSMFEVGELENSKTARQLNEFHPPAVDPSFLDVLRSIDGITNVSDHAQLFSNTGDAAERDDANSGASSQPPHQPRRRKKACKPLTQVLDDIEQAVLWDEVGTTIACPRRSGSLRAPSPALSLGRYSGARCSIFEQGSSLADIVRREVVVDCGMPVFSFRGVEMPVLQLTGPRVTVAWSNQSDSSDSDEGADSWAILEQAERMTHSERARRAATQLRDAASSRPSVSRTSVCSGRLSEGLVLGAPRASLSRASLGHFEPNRPSLVLGRQPH